MRRLLLPLLVLLLVRTPAAGEESHVGAPYEKGTGFVPQNAVDACVLAALAGKGIEPANPCSDSVFVRRVHLDLLGILPDPTDAERFLRDRAPDKRTRLVDALLEREEFVDWWALKWGDLLRVKAEYPINLWPNGVQAYHRWIRDAVARNVPYDRFARALLTSSGSNFRVGPVNFYRAVQGRKPAQLAAAVALTFLGQRLERWPPERQAGMAAFFSRIAFKPTAEWKEEIVILDPAPAGPLAATFPDGTAVTVPPDVDPRGVFADWLLAPDNPYFARAIANRAWSWFFGRGIVHEPDDIRDDDPPSNPPSNPALLAWLERYVAREGYDLKRLFRLIVTSRAYQSSPIPRSQHPDAEALFGFYPVRQLDAEVLIDALCRLDGAGEEYVSIIPEPFTFLPNTRRSVTLADGSITSPFLEMFGRPARDTGLESERRNEPTDAQRLHLLNSSDVLRHITQSPWLRRLAAGVRGYDAQTVRFIYLALLSREPTAEEEDAARAWFRTPGLAPRDAVVDLVWAILNGKEFLFRH